MKEYRQGFFTGERALYNLSDAIIYDSTFDDGESPLKESKNIELNNSIFKWKYPLWYSSLINLNKTVLQETARSGIWYSTDITFNNSVIEAPKTFRRSSDIKIFNTDMPNAQETMWNCNNITIENSKIKGDYFAMNSSNIKAKNINIYGNYSFDGASNIEIDNAYLISKDALWNTKNVVVKNSTIIGEYLGWNSENVTFINCTIDSKQGLCYMKNVKLVNCKLLNTNLSFEFVSDIDAKIDSKIDSIKNPISGRIEAISIGDIILDETYISKDKTTIIVKEK